MSVKRRPELLKVLHSLPDIFALQSSYDYTQFVSRSAPDLWFKAWDMTAAQMSEALSDVKRTGPVHDPALVDQDSALADLENLLEQHDREFESLNEAVEQLCHEHDEQRGQPANLAAQGSRFGRHISVA